MPAIEARRLPSSSRRATRPGPALEARQNLSGGPGIGLLDGSLVEATEDACPTPRYRLPKYRKKYLVIPDVPQRDYLYGSSLQYADPLRWP